MTTTIEGLKEQYGHNSPAAAEKINCIADDKTSNGDNRSALKYHQEALKILEWNKCNALLYDLTKKSKEYAVDMAITLRKIGNILRVQNNNFIVAAGECMYPRHSITCDDILVSYITMYILIEYPFSYHLDCRNIQRVSRSVS